MFSTSVLQSWRHPQIFHLKMLPFLWAYIQVNTYGLYKCMLYERKSYKNQNLGSIICSIYFPPIIHDAFSVQLLSRVWLFVTPWIAACQGSLSITSSRSSPKLKSIDSVMSSNHLSSVVPFSSRLQSFPALGSFPMSWFFTSGSQSIGASVSSSVLPMNIQDWFPLGLTGWISLQSKGLSRVFSNTTVQRHQFFGAQLSL